MDEKMEGSSKVDAIFHAVSFYPRSSPHTVGHPKAMLDAQIETSTHTRSSPTSIGVSIDKKMQKTAKQSNRYVGAGKKSKVLERRSKSIESLRLTSINSRLIRKSKYTLLPFKRGQLKFCSNLRDAAVRSGAHVALNSELAAGKENKVDYVDSGASVVTEKLNRTAGAAPRRFFRASFGKRQKFTLDMRSVHSNRMKMKHSKQHEKNAIVANKQLEFSAAIDRAKPESGTEESHHNDSSTACVTGFTLGEDGVHKNYEVAAESAEVPHGSSPSANRTLECAVVTDSVCSADVEQHSDITSTSDAASVAMSTPKLYSDRLVIHSPSLKQGIFSCFCSLLLFNRSWH